MSWYLRREFLSFMYDVAIVRRRAAAVPNCCISLIPRRRRLALIHETGEYAILLRSDLHGRGLGWVLMQLIIEYAKSEGQSRIYGEILQKNSVMLKMCRELGFKVKTDAEDGGVCGVTLVLEGG